MSWCARAPRRILLLPGLCWSLMGGCSYTEPAVCDDPATVLSADGFPMSIDHCGACHTDCHEVFPDAAEVDCVAGRQGLPVCVITACPAGSQLFDSACMPFVNPWCMPCLSDDECASAHPDALCIEMDPGDLRCGKPCAAACPDGIACAEYDGAEQCIPTFSACSCTPANEGALLGCRLEHPTDPRICPGWATCANGELSACLPYHEEVCDGLDNNCDGWVDESFIVDGHYVSDAHCGACNHPCSPHLESLDATCVLVDDQPTCDLFCREGYADLDGVVLNGCECQRRDVTWPPSAHGVDGDCDGVVDDLSDNVYVAKTGNDANPGTLQSPVASLARAVALAAPNRRTVFIATGEFEEVLEPVAGVSMFGGYRSDFLERDPVRYPTSVLGPTGRHGLPVLVAAGIRVPTQIAGLQIVGRDAVTPGTGATAALFSDCGPELELWDLVVRAGRARDGADGLSSSEILASLGVPSVAALDGVNGAWGVDGAAASSSACVGLLGAGGARGTKTCPVTNAVVNGGSGADAICPDTGCVAGGAPCPNGGCLDYTHDGVCDVDAVYDGAVANLPAGDGAGPTAGAGGPLTYDAPTTWPDTMACSASAPLRREGGRGEDGGPGDDGGGGEGWLISGGTFEPATGLWRAGDGTDGDGGTDGSGGGGATAGAAYDVVPGGPMFDVDHLGGSGGGGGSGGCGAPGGRGGQGGGSSIAVAILLGPRDSGPGFHDVRVIPARAGNGGRGGIGAAGGRPGAGGLGGKGAHWCAADGGTGGNGGRGGAGGGGGGAGGGSISGFHVVTDAGVDVTGYVEMLEANNSVDPLPAPGARGQGGYSSGHAGSDGVRGDALPFRVVVDE